MTDAGAWQPKAADHPSPRAPQPADPVTVALEDPGELFATYQEAKGHPFMADLYGIPDIWNMAEGGYQYEIQAIESYFQTLVKAGELDNSTTAVKTKLKQIEHQAGVDKTERISGKLGRLAAYVRFLEDVRRQEAERRKYVD